MPDRVRRIASCKSGTRSYSSERGDETSMPDVGAARHSPSKAAKGSRRGGRKGAGKASSRRTDRKRTDAGRGAAADSGTKASGRGSSKKKSTRKGTSQRTPFQHILKLVKWVDLIIEVLDARLPISTRHPNAAEIFGTRPRLFILTKEDIADSDQAAGLCDRLTESTGFPCLLLSLKRSQGRARVINEVLRATSEKRQSLDAKGILPRPMRICVAGLPNVGKSSLINWLIGRKKTRVGNKPGITQGTQWVRVHPQLELLDTPGILPPTSFDPVTFDRLAMFNLLPQGNYDHEHVAERLLDEMKGRYPELLDEYISGLCQAEDGLTRIAEARNLLTSGARLDRRRAAELLLSEFRDGRVGRVTLDS